MAQTKKNKILAILGSPHKDGITAKMLGVALDECRLRGDDITFVNLFEKNIRFCTGCSKCLDAGECVIKNDDIAEITSQIKSCDTVILAAPVYWANVPAAVKNLFDRLRGAAMEETAAFPKPRLSGRKYILLTSCNTPMPFARLCGQSTGALRAMKEFFKTGGMKCAGVVVCSNALSVKELSQRKKAKIKACVK